MAEKPGPGSIETLLGTNFEAIPDNNTYAPPGTHGAAGPNHLMTMLNTEHVIQDKTGTALVGPASTVGFWTSGTGLTGTPVDPRVVYDSIHGRWLATARDNNTATSQVYFAISHNSDPTGTWSFYSFDADAADMRFASFPTMGVNTNYVAICANMHDINTFGHVGNQMWVIDKSTALAGGALTVKNFAAGFDVTPPASFDGFSLQPCVTFGSESTLYIVDNPNVNSSGTPLLRLSQITGPADDPDWSVVPGSTFTGSGWFLVNNDFDPNQIDAAQSGSATRVDTQDSRICGSAVFRNGTVWFTHSGGLPDGAVDRTAVFWYQCDPTAMPNPIQQSGVIDDGAETHLFFPSIAVNVNNDVCIGFSRSDASRFVEGAFTGRMSTDPAGQTDAIEVLKAGEDTYVKDFGSGNVFWGPYSATVVDPGDDTAIWTLQTVAAFDVGPAANDDRWTTWWGTKGSGGGGSGEFAFGWEQSPLGGATLSGSGPVSNAGCGGSDGGEECGGAGDETLQIEGVDTGGDDGFQTSLGNSDGVEIDLSPVAFDTDGKSLRVDLAGRKDDVSGIPVGHFGVRNNGGIIEVFADLSPLYPDGNIRVIPYTGSGPVGQGDTVAGGGALATITDAGNGLPNVVGIDTQWSGFIVAGLSVGVVFDRPVTITPVGGTPQTADRVLLLPEGLEQLQSLETVRMTGENLDAITVTDQRVGLNAGLTSTMFHGRKGAALLMVDTNDEVTVTNLGPTGEDGVYINARERFSANLDPFFITAFGVNLRPVDLASGGDQMTFSLHGTVDGMNCTQAGQLMLQNNGGATEATPDFAGLNAPNVRVTVFEGGTEKGSHEVANGIVAASWTSGTEIVSYRSATLPAFQEVWLATPVAISISGNGTLTGNRVRFTALGATKEIEELSCSQICSNVEFTMTDRSAGHLNVFGLEQIPTGEATVTRQDGKLVVGNIDGDGEDGVSTQLGNSEGADSEYDPPISVGTSGVDVVITAIGETDQQTEAILSQFAIQNTGTEQVVSIDVTGLGAGDVEVIVKNGTTTEVTKIVPAGAIGTITDAGNGLPGMVDDSLAGTNPPIYRIGLGVQANITIDGMTFPCDRLIVKPLDPNITVKAIVKKETKFANTGDVTKSNEWVRKFGHRHGQVGNARFELSGDALNVKGITSGEYGDGFRVQFVDPANGEPLSGVNAMQFTFENLILDEMDQQLAGLATATVGGTPDQTAFSWEFVNDGTDLKLTTDFSPLGTNRVFVDLVGEDGSFRGGSSIAPGQPAISRIEPGPMGSLEIESITPQVSTPARLVVTFTHPVMITAGGTSDLARTVVISAVDQTVNASDMTEVQFTALNTPSMSVLGEDVMTAMNVHGQIQEPFGGATISESGGNLIVEFGGGPDSGFTTRLFNTEGVNTGFASIPMDVVGRSLKFDAVIVLEGDSNLGRSSVTVRNNGGTLEIDADTETLNPNRFRVIVHSLVGGKEQVELNTFVDVPSGVVATVPDTGGGLPGLDGMNTVLDGGVQQSIVFDDNATIRVNNTNYTGHRVVIIPIPTSADAQLSIREAIFAGENIDTITINSQGVILHDHPVGKKGQTQLKPEGGEDGSMGATIFGSNGTDGMFAQIPGFDPDSPAKPNDALLAFDNDISISDDTSLTINTIGEVSTIPDVSIGSLDISAQTGTVTLTSDFAPTGSVTVTVEVRDDNTIVSSNIITDGNLGATTSAPIVLNEIRVSSAGESEFIEICSDVERQFTIAEGGGDATGECIRFTTVNSPNDVDETSGIEVLGTNLSSFTVTEIVSGTTEEILFFGDTPGTGRRFTPLPFGEVSIIRARHGKLDVHVSGNNPNDGVSCEYKLDMAARDKGVKLGIAPLDLQDGKTILVGAGGKIGGANTFLGFGQVTNTGSTIEISADWDPNTGGPTIGPHSTYVRLCKKGEVVGQFFFPNDTTVGTLPPDAVITGLGTVGTEGGEWGYRICVGGCQPFTVAGGGPTIEVDVDEIKLTAGGFDGSTIDEVTNVDLQGTQDFSIFDAVIGNPTVRFAGLNWRPIGEGAVGVSGNSLTVGNLTGGTDDGTTAILRGFEGVRLDFDHTGLDPDTLPTGALLVLDAKTYQLLEADFDGDGDVDGDDYETWVENFGKTDATRADGDANEDGLVNAADYIIWRNQEGRSSPEVSLGQLSAEDNGIGFDVSVNWGDGSTTSRVVVLDNDDSILADVSSVGNPAVEIEGPIDESAYENDLNHDNDQWQGFHISSSDDVSITISGQPAQTGKSVLILNDNPGAVADPVRSVSITVNDVDEYTVNEAWVKAYGWYHQSVGNMLYNPYGDNLRIEANDTDPVGVRIRTVESHAFTVYLTPLDPFAADFVLSLAAQGTANSIANTSLGTAAIQNNAGTLELYADYTDVNSPEIELRFYDIALDHTVGCVGVTGGGIVGTVSPGSGGAPVIRSIGYQALDAREPGFFIATTGPVLFTPVLELPIEGDLVYLEAEDVSVNRDNFAIEFELTVAGGGGFEIDAEQFSPPRCGQGLIGDGDNDGVPDGCDQCLDTHPFAPVDEKGCPPPCQFDLDNDGNVDNGSEFSYLDGVLPSGANIRIPLELPPDFPDHAGPDPHGLIKPDYDSDNDLDQSDLGLWQAVPRVQFNDRVQIVPDCGLLSRSPEVAVLDLDRSHRISASALESGPQILDDDVTVSLPNATDLNGGFLRVTRLGGGPFDELGILSDGTILVGGGSVFYQGNLIADIAQDGTLGALEVNFVTTHATAEAVKALIEHITLQRTQPSFITSARIRIQLDDGKGHRTPEIEIRLDIPDD